MGIFFKNKKSEITEFVNKFYFLFVTEGTFSINTKLAIRVANIVRKLLRPGNDRIKGYTYHLSTNLPV